MPRDERGSCIQLVRKTRFNSLFRTDEENPSPSNMRERYIESFNGKLRDELLDREVFYTLREVQTLTEQHKRTYNQIRPIRAVDGIVVSWYYQIQSGMIKEIYS